MEKMYADIRAVTIFVKPDPITGFGVLDPTFAKELNLGAYMCLAEPWDEEEVRLDAVKGYGAEFLEAQLREHALGRDMPHVRHQPGGPRHVPAVGRLDPRKQPGVPRLDGGSFVGVVPGVQGLLQLVQIPVHVQR